MFYHITIQVLDRSLTATWDYFKMETWKALLIPLCSQQEKGLVGEVDNEFSEFQIDRNRTSDFCATAVNRVSDFIVYRAEA